MDDHSKNLIKDYKFWTLNIHPNQCYLGRTYIWAKRDDAVDLMDATSEELLELQLIGKELKSALDSLWKPDMVNYAALGNVTRHLHMHVIPRYRESRELESITFSDDRFGKNHVPYNREFKIPESTLLKIRDNIKKKLI
jgi:diadenosine tetraphosphate (Ap4A) HIT family hydrolase